MSYARQNQPQSERPRRPHSRINQTTGLPLTSSNLESHSSDWESLQLWSSNDSSSKLTYLIEREALPTTFRSREINSSTKPLLSLTLGLTLCLILYGLGLITLSKNIPSLTEKPQSASLWL